MSNFPSITTEGASQPALTSGQSTTQEAIELVKFETRALATRADDESMQLIEMQTVELLNCQSNMVLLQELVGYVMELRRVVAIHSESFATLRPYLLEKEEQQTELLSQLNRFAGQIARRDKSSEFLHALTSLERSICEQRVFIEIASLDQKALDARQSKLSERMASNEQVKLLHSLIHGLQENLKTQARSLGELQARTSVPSSTATKIDVPESKSMRAAINKVHYNLDQHEKQCEEFCNRIQRQVAMTPSIPERFDKIDGRFSFVESKLQTEITRVLNAHSHVSEEAERLTRELASTNASLTGTQEELRTVKLKVNQVHGILSTYQEDTSGTSDASSTSNPWSTFLSAQNAVNGSFLHQDRRTFCDRVREGFLDIGTWTKANWKITLIFALVLMIGK